MDVHRGAEFTIGEWFVIPAENRITGPQDRSYHVSPKAMDVLVCLAKKVDLVVTKDELLSGVWGTQFVTEGVLANAVSELRGVFGDDARHPRFIQTIPKRGYRLVTPAKASAAPDLQPPQAPARRRRMWLTLAVTCAVVGWLLIEVASQPFPFFRIPNGPIRLLVFFAIVGLPIALVLAWAFKLTPPGSRRTGHADSPDARPPDRHRLTGRTLEIVIIGGLVVAVSVMAWQHWAPQKAVSMQTKVAASLPESGAGGRPSTISASASTSVPQRSIAVLPFENLNVDKKDAYFVAGMQDLILTKLADIGDLKVISRISTASYASQPNDLKAVGQQLGVATVLEGSVQKAGDQVLVNVQLIDTGTDAHVWAQAYTRTLDNVFGVEGEVAEKIANALNAKLSPTETKRLATALSSDPTANDLYLRANYYVNHSLSNADAAVLERAIPLYRRALARVPDFALAHARLSYTESLLAALGGGGQDIRQLDADARAQAKRAMDLAPNLAESHLAIGYCDYYCKGDYVAALHAFADALKLRPNDADSYLARGYVLRRQGKFNQAINAFKHALALDPRNTTTARSLGVTYMATNRYLEAERVLRQAMTLDLGSDYARTLYATANLLRTGDVNRYLALVQGNSPTLKKFTAGGLAAQRKYLDAIALIKSIPDTRDNFPLSGESATFGFTGKDIDIGDYYRLSGDFARAREYYARALPDLRAQLFKLTKPTRLADLWDAIAAAEIGLGKTGAGIAAIKSAVAEGEKSGDRLAGPRILMDSAVRYAQAGRADEAVSLISRALAAPGIGVGYSPVMLWIDHRFDPIRKSQGFQALLKKYAKDRPATVSATTGK